MTTRVYKTANGKNLDVGALMLKNEKVRAVGNMDVNARGDKIDATGKTTMSRARQITRNLKKQTVNTTESPILSSQKQLKNSEATSGIQAALDRAQKK